MQRFQNRMTVPTKYIVLRRSDLVAKAISVHFAMENNQWFEERGKTLDNEQVQYDYATIKHINTFLGFEGLDIPAPPTQKQKHPLKESFRKLFLTEYKADLKQQRSKK